LTISGAGVTLVESVATATGVPHETSPACHAPRQTCADGRPKGLTMAKALLGHVGGLDARLVAEVASLRRQVRELESEVLRLRAETDALAAAASRGELLTLDVTDVESGTPVLA
jgi:hypothetical protein